MRADSSRQVMAVLCLVSGVLHLLGGRFLVMLLGVGYLAASVGLFAGWRAARALTGGVAGVRLAGTILLMLYKLPGLLAGTAADEDAQMLVRDGFWLLMNAAILGLYSATAPARDPKGRPDPVG